MAIWQYQFLLIPQRDLFELGAVYHLPASDLNSFSFWKKEDYSLEFFKPITDDLPAAKSWNDHTALFGSADSTFIEITTKDSSISEVSVTVDYRDDIAAFLKTLLAFCNQNSIALLDESNYVRLLDLGVILSVITDSPQAKEFAALNQA